MLLWCNSQRVVQWYEIHFLVSSVSSENDFPMINWNLFPSSLNKYFWYNFPQTIHKRMAQGWYLYEQFQGLNYDLMGKEK